MRIVHTCLRYPPATGGVETYVRELVKRTRSIAQNIDVRVLTSKMRTHGPITELSPDRLLYDPPYVQRLHHLATPLVSYPRLQALNYYLGHHQPDLVHAYSFWYQPADTTAIDMTPQQLRDALIQGGLPADQVSSLTDEQLQQAWQAALQQVQ